MSSYEMPKSAVGSAAPVLAYNLENLSDWTTQMPFIDITKTMRSLSFITSEGGKIDPALIDCLDENGWPTEMPEGVESFQGGWAWRGEDAAASRAGVYVLTYEGTGTVEMGGWVEVLSVEDGRITFRHPGDATFRVQILDTDPEGTGDYIHEMSIVREDLVELHEAGAIFNPEFLAQFEDVRQIRFMDWMSTNHNPVSSWGERATLDDVTWTLKGGAPVEVMVALANQVGADPWFCMPHDADAEFIRNFATYVRDNLDPDLKAHVEFSNETWNWGFDQSRELQAAANAAWGEHDGVPSLGLGYQAKLMTETALIWREVFGEEAEARLVNVLATQATVAWRTEQLLKATAWFEIEPETAVDPASVFDSIATTTYFGASTFSDQAMRDGLLAAINDPDVDANDWLAARLMDPEVRASVPQRIESMLAQKAVADAYGLDLITYEGGQHVHQNLKNDADGVLNAFREEFVRTEQMSELYQELWDAWAEIGDGPFMQFTMVGAASKYGSWGLRSSLDDENPRAALIDALGAETAPWWDETREEGVFQHGVTLAGGEQADELVGTIEEDFLLGGAGDDLLIGGAGDDGLHGGDGIDTAVFSGDADDYQIFADGDAWVITGADGTDRLVQIEQLLFLESGTISPEQMFSREPAMGSAMVVVRELDDLSPVAADAPGSPSSSGSSGLSGSPSSSGSSGTLGTLGTLGLDGIVTVEAGIVSAGEFGTGVRAINPASRLGVELRDAGYNPQTAFLFYHGGETVEIGGVDVRPIYSSLQEDRIDGVEITGSAMQTAMQMASIVFAPVEIHGSDSNDSIHGSTGDDIFLGLDGNDFMQGGEGDDLLWGGEGRDKMQGGAGADTFIFARGDGVDRILDLEAEDRIELRGFDAADPSADLVDLGVADINANGDLRLSWGDDALVIEGHGLEALAWIDLDWA
jgi:hypothetical protein